jgi:hypothetical protein
MQKMSPGELRGHLAVMEQERKRIEVRRQARRHAGIKSPHDARAAILESRLGELIGAGKQLLEAEPGNRRIEPSRPLRLNPR